MGSSSSRTTPQHGRGEKYFTVFLLPYMKHGLSSIAVLAVYSKEPSPDILGSQLFLTSCDSYGICYKNQVFGSFSWHSHLSLTYYDFYLWTGPCVTFSALFSVSVLFPHRKLNQSLTNKNFKYLFLKIGRPTKVYPLSLPDQSQKSNTCRRCYTG